MGMLWQPTIYSFTARDQPPASSSSTGIRTAQSERRSSRPTIPPCRDRPRLRPILQAGADAAPRTQPWSDARRRNYARPRGWRGPVRPSSSSSAWPPPMHRRCARRRVRSVGRGVGTRSGSRVGRYVARLPNRSPPRARRQRRFRQYSIPYPQPSPMRILFRFCCTTAATCGRPSPPRQRLSSLRAWCQGVRRICDVGPSGEYGSQPRYPGGGECRRSCTPGCDAVFEQPPLQVADPGRTGRLLGSWWRPACAWWANLARRELEHDASRHRALRQSCLVRVSRRLASDAPTVYDRVVRSTINVTQGAKDVAGILWRAMVILHRYLGIVIGLLMATWFVILLWRGVRRFTTARRAAA